jgi:VTC domain-containing protein
LSFRKEVKFRLSYYELNKVKSNLVNKGMKKLFPARRIHSIYFENKMFGMFSDSEEGSLPRKKVRIRHYPDTSMQKVLEIKTSSIEGRFKTTAPLSDSDHERLLSVGYIDGSYGVCQPIVEVSYIREYFELQGVRITFDTKINYKNYKTSSFHKESEVVIEIKSPYEVSDDFLVTLITIPPTRFSKYCRAIQGTHRL